MSGTVKPSIPKTSVLALLALTIFAPSPLAAQGTRADYERADSLATRVRGLGAVTACAGGEPGEPLPPLDPQEGVQDRPGGHRLSGPVLRHHPAAPVTFVLHNRGTATATDRALHPQDARPWLASDVYRLSVSVDGEGWSARLRNGLAAVRFGESQPVTVYLTRGEGAAEGAVVTLTATSEGDPSASASAARTVR